jgi:hypothetical protein
MIPKPEKNAPTGHNITQMSVKYSKWPQNISTISNLRPFKIYSNWVLGLKINHQATLSVG